MIKAVGVEETDRRQLPGCPVMEWNCEANGVDIEAAVTLDEGDTDARKLFNTGVLMLAHLTLPPHLADLNTSLRQVWAAGLVKTPIHYVLVTFYKDTQDTMDVGVLMERIYQWSQVASDRINITCNAVSHKVATATCSAISVGSTSTPIEITFKSVSTESWPWLLYALSSLYSSNISLTIRYVGLTKSDLSRIAGVLRCNYPHPKEPRNTVASSFGFVDIMKGATVRCLDPEGLPFTVSNSVRCRAWFSEENSVEVVIPGVGICQSRIGDGVSVIYRDIESQKMRKPSALRKLHVAFTPIESVSLVTNLLELIGGNLRSLSLRISPDNSDRALDLSVLSAVCPNLESLTTYVFDVVASIHNEALSLWPIKELTITNCGNLTDIPMCLRNPSLRMARELEELTVNYFEHEFDEREVGHVWAHDGDFLSLVKEPFPIQSKAAMISVVKSADNSKTVHGLDADVLRTIFVFASTPAQRSVYVWTCYSQYAKFWARRRHLY